MAPRIQPVSLADADPETRELLDALSTFRDDDVSVLNVFGTIAQHPKLMKRWLVFANHVLLKSTISGRDRELAILRAGWRCNAPYEWGQHVVIGRREGITDDEIARIARRARRAGLVGARRRDPAGRRRAARPRHDLRRDLGDAHRALRPAAVHGPGVRDRPVPPRLVRAEHVRGRARRRPRRRARSRSRTCYGLTTPFTS